MASNARYNGMLTTTKNKILMKKWIQKSGSSPRWENITSGYHSYLLKGLNLRYMYCSKNNFSEKIEINQYEQQKVGLILICFYFINFGFKLRYMYRKTMEFSERSYLEPNYDYIETKRS